MGSYGSERVDMQVAVNFEGNNRTRFMEARYAGDVLDDCPSFLVENHCDSFSVGSGMSC